MNESATETAYIRSCSHLKKKKKSALIPKSLNSDGVVKTMYFKNHRDDDVGFKTTVLLRSVNLLSKHMYLNEHLRYTEMYI